MRAPKNARSIVVSLTLAALLAFLAVAPGNARLDDPRGETAHPAIAWNSEALNLNVEPGGETLVGVSFAARWPMTDVTVGAVGEIADYVSLNPSSFRLLEAGESSDLEVSIAVPPDTAPGSYRGALRVYKNGVHVAKPLPVWIIVTAVRYIYLAGGEYNSRHLTQAYVWGSGLDKSFVETEDDPYDVAASSEHVYWADLGEGKIGRAKRDGTDVNWNFVTLPAGWHPSGIAVGDGNVYWTAFHCTADCTEVDPAGRIGRADLDGTNVSHSFMTVANPGGPIAVSDSRIYWTTSLNTIRRANKDGTNQQTFVSVPDAEFVGDIATGGNYLYWSEGFVLTIGRIHESGLGHDPDFIATSNPFSITGLAVDSTYIYFSSTEPDWVGRVGVDGSSLDLSFMVDEPSYDVAVEPD